MSRAGTSIVCRLLLDGESLKRKTEKNFKGAVGGLLKPALLKIIMLFFVFPNKAKED